MWDESLSKKRVLKPFLKNSIISVNVLFVFKFVLGHQQLLLSVQHPFLRSLTDDIPPSSRHAG